MAIRKVKFTLVPTDTARQIAALVATEDGWEWPAVWATLQTAAHEAMEQILEETTEIRALCETLADAEGVEAGLDADDDLDTESFVCGVFEIDLRDMIAGDDHAAATALVLLLEATRESTSYYADVLVGGKRVELDEAARSIATEFQAQGIDVGSDGVPGVSFGPEWGATANPPPPTPQPEKKTKAPKPKANTNTQGGFGGLDEDEATRNQPRAGASHGLGFTHEEHFFIYQTQITWPIPSDRLDQLRKRVLSNNHPDNYATASDDDRRAAHERFVLLETGAGQLLKRLKQHGS